MTIFLPLLELCKSLGATYMEDMSVGRNAKYTSERFMQENSSTRRGNIKRYRQIIASFPILFSLY